MIWTDHLIVAPVFLPLAGAAVMLLLDRGHLVAKAAIALVATFGVLIVSILLLRGAASSGFAGEPATTAYHLGGWGAPFGIVLVIDWLSALMLLLTSVLALSSLIYALARWDQAGPRFHSMFLLEFFVFVGIIVSERGHVR